MADGQEGPTRLVDARSWQGRLSSKADWYRFLSSHSKYPPTGFPAGPLLLVIPCSGLVKGDSLLLLMLMDSLL